MCWRVGGGKELPAGFMGEGVGFSLHLCGDGRPADALQVAIFDDSEEKVLVGFMIPLGRHCIV